MIKDRILPRQNGRKVQTLYMFTPEHWIQQSVVQKKTSLHIRDWRMLYQSETSLQEGHNINLENEPHILYSQLSKELVLSRHNFVNINETTISKIFRSLNYAYANGELSITEKQGVIVCLTKPNNLKSWRTISLLNTIINLCRDV